DLPFDRLVELLKPHRRGSHNPLFQIMFELNHSANTTNEQDPEESRWLEIGTSKFDLSLTMLAEGDRLLGSAEYCTDLFDDARIERMMGHFQVLLEAAVATPDCPITELPLLTSAERQQILVEWNATAVNYPSEQGVHELIEAQVARRPDAVAVIFED